MLNGNFVDSNLFGSGERLAVEINGGKYSQVFSVQHTDPYFTVDGVSRRSMRGYVERERLTSSFSQFTTQTYSAGFGIGYPLSENQAVNFGLIVQPRGSRHGVQQLARSCATGCATTATTISAASAATRARHDPRHGRDHRWLGLRQPRSHAVSDARRLHRLQFSRDAAGQRRCPTRPRTSARSSSSASRCRCIDKIPFIVVDRSRLGHGVRRHDGACRRTGTSSPAAAIRCAASATARSGRATRSAIPTAVTPASRRSSRRSSRCRRSSRPRRASACSSTSGQSYYLGDTEFRNRRGDRTDYQFDLGELRGLGRRRACSGCRRWACSASATRSPLRYQERDAARVRRRARTLPVFSRPGVLTPSRLTE